MSRARLKKASIEELLELAHAGNRSALEELFHRCRPMLRAWAYERMGNSRRGAAGGSDITQETARLVFEGFPDFDGRTKSRWNAWLKKIFLNCIAEMSRDAGRQKRDDRGTLSLDSLEVEDVPAREKSPSQMVAHREEQERLLVHISKLPTDQGLAILYCHLRELPWLEVAGKMKTTPEAIGGLLYRGLKGLRAHMTGGSTVSSGEGPEELALIAYLRRRAAGEEVDRETFLAEHAAYAKELRPLLEAIERIRAIWKDPPDSE